MTSSTINSKLTHGVTLGSPGYLSPLTITSAGYIAPSAAGATALYATITAGHVLNQGSMIGGTGSVGGVGTFGGIGGIGGTGGTGGNGVHLAGGSLINDGVIFGGVGGDGGTGGQGIGTGGMGGFGGDGGIGVDIVAGSLTNDGTISGGELGAPGAGGPGNGGQGQSGVPGDGGIGVRLQSGGTLTNAGRISGGFGIEGTADAVLFGSGASRLILDPGASFNGLVVANASFGNVLELASGASTGTIAGLGGTITGFGTIQFDANASWLLEGGSAGLAAAQTINGFASGDTIELTGFVATGRTFISSGLVLSGTGGSELVGIQGNFTTNNFIVTNDGTNSFVEFNARCFMKGTKILTDHGEVAVERLAVGDHVVTDSGETIPIDWIGHRHVDCRTHPDPRNVWPVRVHTGAFGDGAPHRDLFLSPDHAVFVDDALIPIRRLINGTSIEQTPMDRVLCFHVELDHHDVLLAEGLPAESYLDTGERFDFDNGDGPIALHPDFSRRRPKVAPKGGAPKWDTLMWDTLGCAPLIVTGAVLETVRRRVNACVAVLTTAALRVQSAA